MNTLLYESVTESLWDAIERVYLQVAQKLGHDFEDQPVGHVSPADPDALNPLQRIVEVFGLSPFERDILVLCAGASIDSRFSELRGGQGAGWTYGLAASCLDEPHWSAASPQRPLRHWRLVEMGAGPLVHASLNIDERILHFLLCVPAVDERLELVMRPAGFEEDYGISSTDEVRAAAVRGASHWLHDREGDRDPLILTGGNVEERVDLFRAICNEAGLRAWAMDANDLPVTSEERARLAQMFTRESALLPTALLVRTVGLEDTRQLEAWLQRVDAPVAVEAAQGSAAERLGGVMLAAPALMAAARKAVWKRHLGPLAVDLDGSLDVMGEAFALGAKSIRQAAEGLRQQVEAGLMGQSEIVPAAWKLCRGSARRSLDELANRIESRSRWNDLVLPEAETSILRQIVANARNAVQVHRDWGFAAQFTRGLGLSVLFSGPSGTGKTMAAGIIAGELDRDLYQIDLATVMSKYIGETEKHLRQIFDTAEHSGAILLFDEADALFGKRSQVVHSNDRFANLEVSYLLQRMESYRGIAILTTNMAHAMDTAFQRRLRFVVQFPFPDAASRERIWRNVFPEAAPSAALDPARLAQLNVTGGVIRNIALLAAFLAANEGGGIHMRHVLAAAKTEYAKLDKPLSAAETRGWE